MQSSNKDVLARRAEPFDNPACTRKIRNKKSSWDKSMSPSSPEPSVEPTSNGRPRSPKPSIGGQIHHTKRTGTVIGQTLQVGGGWEKRKRRGGLQPGQKANYTTTPVSIANSISATLCSPSLVRFPLPLSLSDRPSLQEPHLKLLLATTAHNPTNPPTAGWPAPAAV
ncbi:hypothetical protein HOO65_070428 [Ceratocystis lukuohia]|uniref:Uncharacterized protein n=1 Tax=Ceratocystis lukuohia TaxID=2019550 RepID=A0ABR4MCI1_9PEZI